VLGSVVRPRNLVNAAEAGWGYASRPGGAVLLGVQGHEHGSWFHADDGSGEGLTYAVTGAEMGNAYTGPETAVPEVVDQL
jgi:hypothetical protein